MHMSNFNKLQAAKILGCYFEKSNKPVPAGTISKDGLKVKQADGDWKYRRQTDKVQKYDIEIGSSYDIIDNAGDKVTLKVIDMSDNSVKVALRNNSFDMPTQVYNVPFEKFHNIVKNKGWQQKGKEEVNPSHFEEEKQYKTFLSLQNSNYAGKRVIDDDNFIDIDYVPKHVSKYVKERAWQLIDTKKSKITEKTNNFLKHTLPQESYHELLINNFKSDSQKDMLNNIAKYTSKDEAEKIVSNYNKENIKKLNGEVFLTQEDLNSKYKTGKFYNSIEDLSKVMSLKNSKIAETKSMPVGNGMFAHLGDYIHINRWNSPADKSKHLISEKARLVKELKSDKYGQGWQFKNDKGETFNIWDKFWNPNINFAGFMDKKNSLVS